jgi:hypothetical protein
MSSYSRYYKPQQSEAFSDRVKIPEDTITTIDRYDLLEIKKSCQDGHLKKKPISSNILCLVLKNLSKN